MATGCRNRKGRFTKCGSGRAVARKKVAPVRGPRLYLSVSSNPAQQSRSRGSGRSWGVIHDGGSMMATTHDPTAALSVYRKLDRTTDPDAIPVWDGDLGRFVTLYDALHSSERIGGGRASQRAAGNTGARAAAKWIKTGPERWAGPDGYAILHVRGAAYPYLLYHGRSFLSQHIELATAKQVGEVAAAVEASEAARMTRGRSAVSSRQVVEISTYKALSGDRLKSWKAPTMKSAALQAITAYRKAGGNVEVQAYSRGWGQGERPGTWLKGSQFTLRPASDGWKYTRRYLDAPSHQEAANLLLSDIGG